MRSCIPTVLKLMVRFGLTVIVAAALSSALAQSPDRHLQVQLHYSAGIVTLVDVHPAPARARTPGELGGWTAQTYAADGRLLDSRFIGDPTIVVTDQVGPSGKFEGGEVEQAESSFGVLLPVDPHEAKLLKLFTADGALIAALPLDPPAVPGTKTLAPCPWPVTQLIDNGPLANRINLTIIGDGWVESDVLPSLDLRGYRSIVGELVDYLFRTEPFASNRSLFNVYRIDATGPERWVSGPEHGPPDTALDCRPFIDDCFRNVHAAMDRCAPFTTTPLVLWVRHSGGFAGGNLTVCGEVDAGPVCAHELGHALGGLGDEYFLPGVVHAPRSCLDVPVPSLNCAGCQAEQMLGEQAKWWYWLDEPDVSTFEGCGYAEVGAYRPSETCKMRSPSSPFCAVCRESLTLGLLRRVGAIDAASPASLESSVMYDESLDFVVTPVPHEPGRMLFQWSIDGTPVAGAAAELFTVEAGDLTPGMHTVRVGMNRTSPFVRIDPAGLTADERAWQLYVNRYPPEADAGVDQTVDCERDHGAYAVLNGTASHDPESAPGNEDGIRAYEWFERDQLIATGGWTPTIMPLGEHQIRLIVTDKGGLADSDTTTVKVQDTSPPWASLVFPEQKGYCTSQTVGVWVSYIDPCDPRLRAHYDPPGAGYWHNEYDGHGDHLVTASATDPGGNTASNLLDFTVDHVTPTATILPKSGQRQLSDLASFATFFTDSDDDGARGDVVQEILQVDDCWLYNGWHYGDGDGLLRDENPSSPGEFSCRLSNYCGRTVFENPTVTVRVSDCGGNEGTASVVIPGRYVVDASKCQ